MLIAADRVRAEETRPEDIERDDQDGSPAGLDGEHASRALTTADYVASTTPDPQPRQARPKKKRQAAGPRVFRSLDATGNVRVLTADMPAESTSGDGRAATGSRRARKPARAATSRTAKTASAGTRSIGEKETALPDTTSSPERKEAPADPQAAHEPAEAGLPVRGYDGLSLAALRARLRNLDATQVRMLLEHERSAGNRADVAGMLERRIARLEATRDAT